ncbi:hypothetical protein Bca101_064068 [Brassica carinata]
MQTHRPHEDFGVEPVFGANQIDPDENKSMRFGPPLPLPYRSKRTSVALFWARDEKLAAVHHLGGTLKIWITTTIEPNEISWSSFLRLDMRLIKGLPYSFMTRDSSFFIDEEKKVAVFIDHKISTHQSHTAHIIGKKGHLKFVNISRNLEMKYYLFLVS